MSELERQNQDAPLKPPTPFTVPEAAPEASTFSAQAEAQDGSAHVTASSMTTPPPPPEAPTAPQLQQDESMTPPAASESPVPVASPTQPKTCTESLPDAPVAQLAEPSQQNATVFSTSDWGVPPIAQPSPAPTPATSAPSSAFGEPNAATPGPRFGATPPAPPIDARGQAEFRRGRRFGMGTLLTTALAAAAVGGLVSGLVVGGLSGAFSPAEATHSQMDESAPVAAEGSFAAAIERASASTVQLDVQSGTGSELGSGVIISSDGLVLTNAHVVTADGTSNDAKVRATTPDGRVYDAVPVGLDPLVDLALIKLEGAQGLTPAEFADSSQLAAGTPVAAIGSPLGLSDSASQGIVSNTQRSIDVRSPAAPEGDPATAPYAMEQHRPEGEGVRVAVIQSDASVNPGNSGGPLIDGQGRVVGINVAIATGSKGQGAAPHRGDTGSIGISFAVPSNVANRIANELQTTHYPSHGAIGASLRDEKPGNADSTHIGARVTAVEPGRAAAKAGIQVDDVVTQLDAVQIREAGDLAAQLRALPAGTNVTIRIVRGGTTVDVPVTLDEL